MATPRQQRSKVNRRTIKSNNPGRPQDYVVEVRWSTANELSLVYPGIRTGLVVTGIPQVTRSDTGDVPTSMAISADEIRLIYPTYFDHKVEVKLAPTDPALRTPLGGYIAPFHVDGIGPTPPPSGLSIVDAQLSSGKVILTWDNGGQVVFINSNLTLTNVTTGQTQTLAVSDGALITATFPVPVSVGNVISVGDADPGFITDLLASTAASSAVAHV